MEQTSFGSGIHFEANATWMNSELESNTVSPKYSMPSQWQSQNFWYERNPYFRHFWASQPWFWSKVSFRCRPTIIVTVLLGCGGWAVGVKLNCSELICLVMEALNPFEKSVHSIPNSNFHVQVGCVELSVWFECSLARFPHASEIINLFSR